MTDSVNQLTPLQKAALAIKELRGRLEAAEAERDAALSNSREPIAVIGMACRFPGGADTPERFWEILRDGVDTVGEVPRERWEAAAYYDPDPAVAGKIVTTQGAYLQQSEIDNFDPQFLGFRHVRRRV